MLMMKWKETISLWIPRELVISRSITFRSIQERVITISKILQTQVTTRIFWPPSSNMLEISTHWQIQELTRESWTRSTEIGTAITRLKMEIAKNPWITKKIHLKNVQNDLKSTLKQEAMTSSTKKERSKVKISKLQLKKKEMPNSRSNNSMTQISKLSKASKPTTQSAQRLKCNLQTALTSKFRKPFCELRTSAFLPS